MTNLILERGRSSSAEKIGWEELRNGKARNSDREMVLAHDRGNLER
jgi:hypothetical protein